MATPLVNFVQERSALNYTPDADLEAGIVVIQNDLVGVTKLSILAKAQGAIHVAGVFEFPPRSSRGDDASTLQDWGVVLVNLSNEPLSGAPTKFLPNTPGELLMDALHARSQAGPRTSPRAKTIVNH